MLKVYNACEGKTAEHLLVVLAGKHRRCMEASAMDAAVAAAAEAG